MEDAECRDTRRSHMPRSIVACNDKVWNEDVGRLKLQLVEDPSRTLKRPVVRPRYSAFEILGAQRFERGSRFSPVKKEQAP